MDIVQIFTPKLAYLFVATTYFSYVGIRDYLHLKIENVSVLIGIGLYVAYIASSQDNNVWLDLAVAASFFAIGVVLWAFSMIGAGDAKFMLVCGLFAGTTQIAIFLAVLLAVNVVMLVVYMMYKRAMLDVYLAHTRIGFFLSQNHVPWGVALSAAALVAYFARLGAI